jgi:hypothetical protein
VSCWKSSLNTGVWQVEHFFATFELKLEIGWQLESLHPLPLAQQVRFAPAPHGVVPAGHPHTPAVWSAHATPAAQHVVPHGVVPAGQQHTVAGSEQVSRF